jgi:hypothetical protein
MFGGGGGGGHGNRDKIHENVFKPAKEFRNGKIQNMKVTIPTNSYTAFLLGKNIFSNSMVTSIP